MSRRFKALKRALRALRSPTAAPNSVTPPAPAGSILDECQKYLAGQKVITYTREASSLPGNEKVISLKPFAYIGASTIEIGSTISSRSLANLALFGLSETELGFTSPAVETVQEMAGYKPAKAICKNVTGTTSVPTPSKITGEKYSKKASSTFTFPIGRTTERPTWSIQKGFVLAEVAKSTGNKSVTFKTEVF
jgi:hypothetical protein